jgi:hypothetical protein
VFLRRRQFDFVGDTLLTAGNPGEDPDAALFRRLGIEVLEIYSSWDGRVQRYPSCHHHEPPVRPAIW